MKDHLLAIDSVNMFNWYLKQKVQKANEQALSEEGDTELKETPVSKVQTKKPGKKQSENEAFKKRMREMYVAVEKYQVCKVYYQAYFEEFPQGQLLLRVTPGEAGLFSVVLQKEIFRF